MIFIKEDKQVARDIVNKHAVGYINGDRADKLEKAVLDALKNAREDEIDHEYWISYLFIFIAFLVGTAL